MLDRQLVHKVVRGSTKDEYYFCNFLTRLRDFLWPMSVEKKLGGVADEILPADLCVEALISIGKWFDGW
jgi:hypothetical protein